MKKKPNHPSLTAQIATLRRQVESLKAKLEKERKARREAMAILNNKVSPVCAWYENILPQARDMLKKGEKK